MNPNKWQRLVRYWRVTISQLQADETQALLMFLSLMLLSIWWFSLEGVR
jgi:hypothetical protein